ncbi:MAG: hypothetical protein IPP25_06730 [Saprospiraceae bacterium]|nr:hypothetical protein [Candidatus Opimibacter skivensis]
MRFFGAFIAIVGLLSIVLPYAGMNFMFLNWVNNWGPGVSWAIRGGLVVLGLIMYIAGKPSDRE